MIAVLALSAFAVDRETVLDTAAAYTSHEWTMSSVNETASCSSEYVSDYTPGTYRGLPYDWGGYYTLAAYDAAIADGLGAGSHSWHGILSCTAGVDCSGFVSKTWEASHHSTSTMHQIATDIGIGELQRADAVNDAGSHIVLFTYETDAGSPIFYEAAGSASKVRINSGAGWSYLNGYQPVRYDQISDGPSTGTAGSTREIESFPFEDFRWTAGAASDAIDTYDCAPGTDESGPEVLYHFSTSTGGTLHVTVSDDQGVDVDVHVLTGTDGSGCLARNDTEVEVEVAPGDVYLSLDTYVGSREFPGPYLLNATFTGDLGEPEEIDPGGSDRPPASDGDSPDSRTRLGKKGCGCASDAQPMGGLLVLVALAMTRRRRRQEPVAHRAPGSWPSWSRGPALRRQPCSPAARERATGDRRLACDAGRG